jgi:cell division protein FtsW (lipid II flippase)
MASFISETSNYLFVWIILFYVVTNFVVFFFKNPEEHRHFYVFQFIIAILFHAVGYITLFMRSENIRYFFFFAFQEIIIVAIVMIYHTIYPSISRLLLNNMIFLLDVSFVILGRLAFVNALRQFIFTVVLLVVSLFIPFIFIKFKGWRKIPYVYCALGIFALASVWAAGTVTHGSKLVIKISDFAFQPSEFVKISSIFFIAALFSQKKNKIRYVSGGLFMLIHIMILVLSKDLGSAGIYLITFIFMLFAATRSPLVLPAGGALSLGAFAFAYKEFAHVRIRVKTWLDPFADVENAGWQLSQSLFAIGTGGWFGMGLFKGYPKSIPYVEEDFIFSAIGEEMGVLFSVLLIMLYLFTALHIIRYSFRVKSAFHQYLLFGFAICFAIQVFITIGGGTRLIPLTGVTLPLISMGGSSLSATIIMFSIIQAIYVKEFDYRNLSLEAVSDMEDVEDEQFEDEFYGTEEDYYEDEYEEGEGEYEESEEPEYEESEEGEYDDSEAVPEQENNEPDSAEDTQLTEDSAESEENDVYVEDNLNDVQSETVTEVNHVDELLKIVEAQEKEEQPDTSAATSEVNSQTVEWIKN